MIERVTIYGARELAVKMRTADRSLRLEMKFANEGAAEVVVDAALPKVPVRSGALRRSLEAKGTVASGRALAQTPYAAAIHWGRKRGNVGHPRGNRMGNNPIRGNPFLWNAAQEKQQQIVDEYQKVVFALMERVIGYG